MTRDFTYKDDILTGVINIMSKTPSENEGGVPYKLYNIGNNKPENLLYFVETLEKCLIKEGIIEKPGEKEFLPMQPGDVYQTYADVDELVRDFNFKPSTSLEEGLTKFVKWYKEYYNKEVKYENSSSRNRVCRTFNCGIVGTANTVAALI